VDESAIRQLQRAESIARRVHEGQLDKAGLPYIDHPRRVAAKLATPDARTVAWLHDVLEDSPTTESELREQFTGEIVDAVVALTRIDGEPSEAYYARVRANELALLVKFADIDDNLDPQRPGLLDGATAERLARMYREALTHLSVGSARALVSDGDTARSVTTDDTRPSLLFAPPCSVCGKRAVLIEIIPPGELPHDWDEWSPGLQEAFLEGSRRGKYTYRFRGVMGGNGLGDLVSESKARHIMKPLVPVFRFDEVHRRYFDDLGYCEKCGAFYCYTHWSPSSSGGGVCPKGHGKLLDPLWSWED